MATVTEANLKYSGSITIDSNLLEAAELVPNEKVQIVNINNGTRVESYCIPGEADSGIICMNGAIARLAEVGDKIIIMSFGVVNQEEGGNGRDRSLLPKIVFVDEKNRIKGV